ncbi:hypothetical protein HBN50_07965 [Halobacteriovorax sp. GB3]|uniref:hypothetical protein n=1 Tax=Halobacteriovorax sp. GB3 TaxID=2719615 RepID=UPI002362976F|nr:hypothetical protein [Halobacteriovorax sp. GB3]MDD0853028.1 hypothetical protein [Halobacteriovorax sp. GB3]
MSITYQEYVKGAKELLSQIDSYQYKIAEMAMAVCQIRHGGRSEGYYTLTEFSNDIGMNRKTLSEWVHAYRDICLKIDLRTPTQEEWSKANKVSRLLKSELATEKSNNNTQKSKSNSRKDVSKERIQKIYNEITNDPFDTISKFERIYESTLFASKTINKIDLHKISNQKLRRTLKNIVSIKEQLEQFLSKEKVAQ